MSSAPKNTLNQTQYFQNFVPYPWPTAFWYHPLLRQGVGFGGGFHPRPGIVPNLKQPYFHTMTFKPNPFYISKIFFKNLGLWQSSEAFGIITELEEPDFFSFVSTLCQNCCDDCTRNVCYFETKHRKLSQADNYCYFCTSDISMYCLPIHFISTQFSIHILFILISFS